MYKVVVPFVDLQDNDHRYEVGDEYPRAGKKAKLARLQELSTTENKRGIVLIEEVVEEQPVEEEVVAEEKPKRSKKNA